MRAKLIPTFAWFCMALEISKCYFDVICSNCFSDSSSPLSAPNEEVPKIPNSSHSPPWLTAANPRHGSPSSGNQIACNNVNSNQGFHPTNNNLEIGLSADLHSKVCYLC